MNPYKLTHFSKYDNESLDKLIPMADKDFGNCAKPALGLWLSDETDYGWKEWCTDEEFRLECLKHPYSVELDPKHTLHICGPDELVEFSKNYGRFTEKRVPWETSLAMGIHWNRVAKEYKAVVITPYIDGWLIMESPWYAGWDCASGVVMDESVIVNFEYLGGSDI